MEKKLKPIHKFNGGKGATLCHKCNIIINIGITNKLYCEECQNKLIIEYKNGIIF